MTRIGVVVFPGTNCEHDTAHALRLAGAEPELVFHRESDLDGLDAVILPGGFAHGDYLRTGAIARFSPVMAPIAAAAHRGMPVLGICNGFQILCEAGLLPGALVANIGMRFICRPVHLRVESTATVLTREATVGEVLRIPLNSYEGNYTHSDGIDGEVALRYCDPKGEVSETANPNGSADSTAAVARGSVAGIMPHPERASEAVLGSSDGEVLMASFVRAAADAAVSTR